MTDARLPVMPSPAATEFQRLSSTDLLWWCGCCRFHSSGLRCTLAIMRLIVGENLPAGGMAFARTNTRSPSSVTAALCAQHGGDDNCGTVACNCMCAALHVRPLRLRASGTGDGGFAESTDRRWRRRSPPQSCQRENGRRRTKSLRCVDGRGGEMRADGNPRVRIFPFFFSINIFRYL